MKKILFLAMFFVASIMVSFAQGVDSVATYHSGSHTRTVFAEYNQKGGIDVYFEVKGATGDDDLILIKVKGEENVRMMKDSMEAVRKKFIEWKEVAISNDVKEFTKHFGIKFPKVETFWYSGEWYSSLEEDCMDMTFFVVDGRIFTGFSHMAKSFDNVLLKKRWYFDIKDEQQLKEFIDALNIDNIRERLGESSRIEQEKPKDIDGLFK